MVSPSFSNFRLIFLLLSVGCYISTFLCLWILYLDHVFYKSFFLAGSVFLILYFIIYANQYFPKKY